MLERCITRHLDVSQAINPVRKKSKESEEHPGSKVNGQVEELHKPVPKQETDLSEDSLSALDNYFNESAFGAPSSK